MDTVTLRRIRIGAVVAALAIIAWTVAGFVDRRDAGFAGPLFEPDYSIVHVPAGSPLEEAGFQPGDRVVSVEGTPIEDLGMYSRWPRSLSRGPGESLTIVVERDGELVSGRIVYDEPSESAASLRLGGLLILLSFLVCGLWALFTVPTDHAARLALIGLALGAAAPGPYLGRWDGVAAHMQVAAVVLWTLLLLRFFLLFPKPKRVGENRLATIVIWAAWGVLIISLLVELIFHPRFYNTFGPLYGLLMTAYSVLAVVAVTHTVVTTSRKELRVSGMSIIVVGVTIAVVFSTVAFIDAAFLWEFSIPGSSYFPLLIAVVPFTMALGVRQGAQPAVQQA